MKVFLTTLLILSSSLSYSSECLKLLSPFLHSKNQSSAKIIYSSSDLKTIENFMSELNLNDDSKKIVLESLSQHVRPVNLNEIKLYLQYSETLRGQKITQALQDIAQLGQREVFSKYIVDFERVSKNLPKKYFLYKHHLNYDEFTSLYFSCKSSVPNDKNENAKKIYTKFSLGLSTATLATSYTYSHRNEEKNLQWFTQLGYEVSFNALTSYLGSKVQSNSSDPQYIKSLKNYLIGRLFGIADIALYPMIVPNDNAKATEAVKALKDSQNFDSDIARLHKAYDERGVYVKFKQHIVSTYRELLKNKQPIEVGGINWDNLTPEDLDRPEVQEVLVLAATVEMYELNRGPLLDTGDVGLDRYAFGSIFSALMIPKNMAQTYISYQILCMGQANPALAITKAAIFNSSINFYIGQIYYNQRKEAINN